MAINNNKLAKELLEAVGGKNNVANVAHCATRLRFNLKDEAKANEEKTKKLQGVVTVVRKAGQFQVVIGNEVSEVYKEVIKAGGFKNLAADSLDSGAPKGGLVNRLIDMIAGIFPPLLRAMCGGGLIKGIVAICAATGLLTPEMGTYIVLHAIGDSVFYFLPVFLGFSAGHKFGGSPYLTAIIGASLLHPDLAALGGLTGTTITFLKIPMTIMNYSSSVIPILLAAYVCCKLEAFFRAKLPVIIRNFVTPTLCLLIVVPLTLFIIGPACLAFSSALARGYLSIHPILGGMLVGAGWQVLVIFGIHWGFVPVMINNISTMGFDTLGPAAQAGAFSQTGAAFGMALKMKDKETKGMALSNVISGIFGITEPIIYGITLPRKKPFILGAIGGAVGGAVGGAMGASAFSMGALGILSLPTAIDPVNGFTDAFFGALAGMVVSFTVAAVLNYITYTDDTVKEKEASFNNSPAAVPGVSIDIYSPMDGKVIPLDKSKDPVYAGETLGKGVMIEPSASKVYAPFNGTVSMLFNTKHALGLTSDDGVELLIHVGIDTVKLAGKYFSSRVTQGQRITKGQLLLKFDKDKILDEGYKLETPIIVTNTGCYRDVRQAAVSNTRKGDKLIEIR